MLVHLAEIAFSRSGDKGNISDISLFAKNEQIYEFLKEEITAEKVKVHFTRICTGEVERYEVPNVLALKFVLHDALGGGASESIRMDNLGKSLSAALLRIKIHVPDSLLRELDIKKPSITI